MWESTRPGRMAKSPKSLTIESGTSLRGTTPTILCPSTSTAKAPIFPGRTTRDDVKACAAITAQFLVHEAQPKRKQTTSGLRARPMPGAGSSPWKRALDEEGALAQEVFQPDAL